MANSTKIAIVGLMILLVVVVAQYVKNDTPLSEDAESTQGTASEAGEDGAGEPDRLAKKTAGGSRSTRGRSARLADVPRKSLIDRPPSGSYVVGRSNRNPGSSKYLRVSPLSGAGNASGGSPSGGASSGGGGAPSGALVTTVTTANGTGTTENGTGATTSGTGSSRPIQPPVSRPETERRRLAEAERLRELAKSRSSDPSRKGSDGTGSSGAGSPGKGRAPYVAVPSKIFDGSKPESPPAAGSAKLPSVGFPKQHLVQEGESYWALSRKYYGAGRFYPYIETANKKAKVIAGKKLTIPAPPSVAIKASIEAAAEAKRKALAKSAASNGKKRRTSTNRPNSSSMKGKSRRSSPLASGKGSSSGGYKLYTVRKGDTLSELAKRFYGDHRLTNRITDVNADLKYIQLQADTTIRIPQK